MAQGRPTKWATATITEPVPLGKAGIKIVVWDKWGKKRRGTAIISVGGIRFRPPTAASFPFRLAHCVLTANVGLPHRSIRDAIALAIHLVVLTSPHF